MNAHLRIVKSQPTTEQTLRELFLERDVIAANLARVDLLIDAHAREYAKRNGQSVRPRIEQVRRQVGA